MRNPGRAGVFLIALSVFGIAETAAQDLWLMKGHDVRRTGQSLGNGPRAIDPAASWTVELPGAHTINIGASVSREGVFFGSWGLLRRDPSYPGDPRFWDKSDGAFYGLDLDTGASLWGGPLDLDLVPRCYDFMGRGPDLFWCGLTPYEVSFYNGTVEGQAAIDTSRNALYVGRGDGKLFAVDPQAGSLLWRYVTFNPELPEDPDGGGEVVSAPLLGLDGTVYFGTWGEGDYETNAFYAVNPDGTLQWRYPTSTSLPNRIFASPALSPDGATIYVSTYYDTDQERTATLYAFHREPAASVPDEQRLKWALDLEHDAGLARTTTLAVGSDGTIYVGGFIASGSGIPFLTAIEDQGSAPAFRWSTPYTELRGDAAQFVLGLALREVGGTTQHLYATTANVANLNAKEDGLLYALDPATGTLLATYDPSDDVSEAVGGITSPAIGADGTIYFGVRGRYGNDARNGHYFAVTYDAQAARFERLWSEEVDGYVEWNHPAIGPDGGLYAGSSSFDNGMRLTTFDEGVTPEGATAYFHALKGPVNPLASELATPALSGLTLSAPYPNPFSSYTTLSLDLAHPGPVRVEVFDVLGRRVRRLHDGFLAAGRHVIMWDGADDAGRPLAAGLYLVRVQANGAAAHRPATGTLSVMRLR